MGAISATIGAQTVSGTIGGGPGAGGSSGYLGTRPIPFACSIITAPLANEMLVRLPIALACSLRAGMSGCIGSADFAPTAAYTLSIRKNGTEIGTCTIATSGVGTFALSGSPSFAVGDVLTIIGAAAVDATIGQIGIALLMDPA